MNRFIRPNKPSTEFVETFTLPRRFENWPVYEQRRVDFFVLCLLALGDTVPQVLFCTIVWDTPEREKMPNGLLPLPAF